jgi:hypothetical protein
LVSERWNQSDRPFAVPGWHHDELGWGCQNYQQKRVCRRLLAANGPPQKVRPNWFWLGLKNCWNKRVIKMILIEVILPGAFDFNKTSDM